jgi:hypothetical protein
MESRRSRREYIALVIVSTVALFLVSSAVKCKKDPALTRTADEIAIDNLINSKVRENLTNSTEVRATDVKFINSVRLNVQLEGQVRSDAERTLVIKITRDTQVNKDGTTYSVKQVEAKNLTVKPE